MFDIGWAEMLVLGIVVLLVMGPRELPTMLRMLGRFAGRLRGLSESFRRQLDDISREVDPRADLQKPVWEADVVIFKQVIGMCSLGLGRSYFSKPEPVDAEGKDAAKARRLFRELCACADESDCVSPNGFAAFCRRREVFPLLPPRK